MTPHYKTGKPVTSKLIQVQVFLALKLEYSIYLTINKYSITE